MVGYPLVSRCHVIPDVALPDGFGPTSGRSYPLVFGRHRPRRRPHPAGLPASVREVVIVKDELATDAAVAMAFRFAADA